jgi:hypothetical protein
LLVAGSGERRVEIAATQACIARVDHAAARRGSVSR